MIFQLKFCPIAEDKLIQRFKTHRCAMDFDFKFVMNKLNNNIPSYNGASETVPSAIINYLHFTYILYVQFLVTANYLHTRTTVATQCIQDACRVVHTGISDHHSCVPGTRY